MFWCFILKATSLFIVMVPLILYNNLGNNPSTIEYYSMPYFKKSNNNPFKIGTWEHDSWEKVKDLDVFSDENEIGTDWNWDELGDYDTKKYLLGLLNKNEPTQAEIINEEIDNYSKTHPDNHIFDNSQTTDYYKKIDEYEESQINKLGGRKAFDKFLEQKSNEVFQNSQLRHNINGPKSPYKEKKRNETFDHWGHHYLTSNGTLTPDANHRALDQYVIMNLGIHPSIVTHQGWLRKYAGAMAISYFNGTLSVELSKQITSLQESRLYAICKEVLDLGGEIYWTSHRDISGYSGSTLGGLIKFIDDSQKNKLKQSSNYK